MLQENALPHISDEEKNRIYKQVHRQLLSEKIGVIGAWVIAILTIFSIILWLATPALKSFNPSGLLEENTHKLYEFKQLEAEVARITERLDDFQRIKIAFLVFVAGIGGGLLFLSVAKAESINENPSILRAFWFGSPGLIVLGSLIFFSATQPNLKIHKFNNFNKQIKAIDYVEKYIQKNYCATFENDEICVLSKGIDNPIKTWTSEQKVAMWYKLRAHEKEVAQRAERANEEQIRKKNKLAEQIKSIKIQ